MGPRDKIWAIRLGGRCLHPLSCLTCLSLDVGEARHGQEKNMLSVGTYTTNTIAIFIKMYKL